MLRHFSSKLVEPNHSYRRELSFFGRLILELGNLHGSRCLRPGNDLDFNGTIPLKWRGMQSLIELDLICLATLASWLLKLRKRQWSFHPKVATGVKNAPTPIQGIAISLNVGKGSVLGGRLKLGAPSIILHGYVLVQSWKGLTSSEASATC